MKLCILTLRNYTYLIHVGCSFICVVVDIEASIVHCSMSTLTIQLSDALIRFHRYAKYQNIYNFSLKWRRFAELRACHCDTQQCGWLIR